jgi:uncharacterized protein YuzE
VIESATRRIASPLMFGEAAIDHYSYDEPVDVLYLTAGPPRIANDTDESLEGSTIFLDERGAVIGVTIIGAREQLDHDGTLDVTLPGGPAARWPRSLVEPLLHETIRY